MRSGSLLVDFVTDHKNALTLRAPRWSLSSSMVMTKITIPNLLVFSCWCFVAIHRLALSCCLTVRCAECLAPQLEICADSFGRYLYLPKHALCGLDLNNLEIYIEFHCNDQQAACLMWLRSRKTRQMYSLYSGLVLEGFFFRKPG